MLGLPFKGSRHGLPFACPRLRTVLLYGIIQTVVSFFSSLTANISLLYGGKGSCPQR